MKYEIYVQLLLIADASIILYSCFIRYNFCNFIRPGGENRYTINLVYVWEVIKQF